MEIPPKGWGAVEILIWEYYSELINLGHNVDIINTPDRNKIIQQIANKKYDFIHIHYDVFYPIIPIIKNYCKNIAITSHYPYIDQIEKHKNDGYDKIFNFLVNNNDFYIFAISIKDADMFIKYGANKDRIYYIQNGSNSNKFIFNLEPNKNKCICLGKIEPRKRQYLISDINIIDFVGDIFDSKFKINKNYLGPWEKNKIYEDLTNYNNMILISEGEADPLVIKEGMMAGLGIIISENMKSIFDTSLEFIDIIPENKINDSNYIKEIILQNAEKCKKIRNKIRKYAEDNFSWSKITQKYVNTVEKIINKYKICLVGPGTTCIPPKGWGAVESLIWDYFLNLKNYDQNVFIINRPNQIDMINEINNINPDIVHIMYDDHIRIAQHIKCKTILYTSHWAYLDQEEKLLSSGYLNFFNQVILNKNRIYIFALSKKIAEMYIKFGFPKNKIILAPNGAREDVFLFNTECKTNKSIYLAKIDYRKSQYKYQSIENIDFVGNISDHNFNSKNLNYLGEWDKETLYKNLTNYGNLILLSDGEADPLVVKEALMAGLGLVISEYSVANLDLNKEFISVINKEKLDDISYIKNIINLNREISIKMRPEIRKYGLEFSWNNIVTKYLNNIKNIYNKSVTLVSCYYKVPSKHSHKKYDIWIKNLLENIKCNIIIFTSDDLIDYLQEIGKNNKNLLIIKKNFNEIDIYKNYNIWDEQYNIDPQKNIRTKECYIIWNSKMNFLKEAIELNPFNSSKFVWNDIGSMRDCNYASKLHTYPNFDNISNDKLDIILIEPYKNLDQKFFQNEVHISGSIFGGTKEVLINIIDLYYKYFNEYLDNKLFVGCDQQIISTLFIQNKNLINIINPNNNIIDPWFYLYYYYNQ